MSQSALQIRRLPDGGEGEQKAYPCIIPPVSAVNDSYTVTDYSWGPTVPANSSTRFPLLTDNDYHYKMIAVRYHALYNDRGVRISYDPAMPLWSGHNSMQWLFPYPSIVYPHGYPLYRYLQVKLWVRTMGDRTMYGDSRDRVTGQYIPLPVECMQGNSYGMAQIRVPYLIQRRGIVEFEFINTHPTKALIANFAIYGMKVRV